MQNKNAFRVTDIPMYNKNEKDVPIAKILKGVTYKNTPQCRQELCSYKYVFNLNNGYKAYVRFNQHGDIQLYDNINCDRARMKFTDIWCSSLQDLHTILNQSVEHLEKFVPKYCEHRLKIKNALSYLMGEDLYMHGGIIDITYLDHVFVDPMTGIAVTYHATSTTNRRLIPNAVDLIKQIDTYDRYQYIKGQERKFLTSIDKKLPIKFKCSKCVKRDHGIDIIFTDEQENVITAKEFTELKERSKIEAEETYINKIDEFALTTIGNTSIGNLLTNPNITESVVEDGTDIYKKNRVVKNLIDSHTEKVVLVIAENAKPTARPMIADTKKALPQPTKKKQLTDEELKEIKRIRHREFRRKNVARCITCVNCSVHNNVIHCNMLNIGKRDMREIGNCTYCEVKENER